MRENGRMGDGRFGDGENGRMGEERGAMGDLEMGRCGGSWRKVF